MGHKTLADLAEAGHRFAEVLENTPAELLPRRAVGGRDTAPTEWGTVLGKAQADARKMGDRLTEMGVRLLFRDDPRFPRALLDLERPPHWLFVQGAMAPLAMPAVAIVGTRKPSEDGLFLARYVGACLSDWPAATVSGLAAGIDQLAHESSLRANVPTIAVLGTGIFDNYPKGSDVARRQILEAGGTIVSEYLPCSSYSAENFVQRNRLQAALGRVVIPVEWARRSGTAHTVRFATALKRPIACLRLSDWPVDRLVLEPGLGQEMGEIFTVPREQQAFDHFVRVALGGSAASPVGQLSLFDEE
ncbi:DNA-processing protein DprA [Aminobacter sp. P9b]|uniref:DNA-processing protein DprA n=1 Tax=Aminobacter sp. P9b TaxID=3133697 RepID=UPI003255E96F